MSNFTLEQDLAYLFSCVEQHADKFPVPDHMRSLVANVRAALASPAEVVETPPPVTHVVPAQNSDNLQLETRSNPSSGDPEYGGADPRALKHDTSQAFPPCVIGEYLKSLSADRQPRASYSFIGDDCPPGYRCVGTIDVADPADVHSAQDKGYRIGTIYDGHSGSCAEPCAADIYERPDEGAYPSPHPREEVSHPPQQEPARLRKAMQQIEFSKDGAGGEWDAGLECAARIIRAALAEGGL